jgi:hypothetical protein
VWTIDDTNCEGIIWGVLLLDSMVSLNSVRIEFLSEETGFRLCQNVEIYSLLGNLEDD